MRASDVLIPRYSEWLVMWQAIGVGVVLASEPEMGRDALMDRDVLIVGLLHRLGCLEAQVARLRLSDPLALASAALEDLGLGRRK